MVTLSSEIEKLIIRRICCFYLLLIIVIFVTVSSLIVFPNFSYSSIICCRYFIKIWWILVYALLEIAT
jgi:hypothetical protein